MHPPTPTSEMSALHQPGIPQIFRPTFASFGPLLVLFGFLWTVVLGLAIAGEAWHDLGQLFFGSTILLTIAVNMVGFIRFTSISAGGERVDVRLWPRKSWTLPSAEISEIRRRMGGVYFVDGEGHVRGRVSVAALSRKDLERLAQLLSARITVSRW